MRWCRLRQGDDHPLGIGHRVCTGTLGAATVLVDRATNEAACFDDMIRRRNYSGIAGYLGRSRRQLPRGEPSRTIWPGWRKATWSASAQAMRRSIVTICSAPWPRALLDHDDRFSNDRDVVRTGPYLGRRGGHGSRSLPVRFGGERLPLPGRLSTEPRQSGAQSPGRPGICRSSQRRNRTEAALRASRHSSSEADARMSGLIRMDRLSTTAGADARSAACSSSGSGYLPSDIPSVTPASNVVEAKGGWRECRTGPRPRNSGSIIFVDPIVKPNARSENAHC